MPLVFSNVILAPALADLLGELLDEEEGGCRRDPFPGVDPGIDEDDGELGVVRVDLHHLDVPPLISHTNHLACHRVILKFDFKIMIANHNPPLADPTWFSNLSRYWNMSWYPR